MTWLVTSWRNLSTSWRTLLRHDVLYKVIENFWLHNEYLTSCDIKKYLWHQDKLFDDNFYVMTYFWHNDELLDIITYFYVMTTCFDIPLTSYCNFDVVMTYMSWRSFDTHDILRYVMMHLLTLWHTLWRDVIIWTSRYSFCNNNIHFDIITYFRLHTFDFMKYFGRHDVLFDVMTYFLMLWRTLMS